jgi:hypothetical protein
VLCTPVVSVAVYVVLYASEAFGVNVAVSPPLLDATTPATAPPPDAVRVKVEPVIVDAFTAELKVAVTAEVIATPVTPLAGVTELTESGEVVLQLLVQVVPPPPPPHPEIARAAATSHHAARIRIINFSSGSFRRRIAQISVRRI